MKSRYLYLLLLVFPTATYAQLTDTGDLAEWVEQLVDDMPGSSGDDYDLPTMNELLDWQNMLEQLFAGNLAMAAELAEELDYDLTLYLDSPSGRTYQVLTANDNNYWGTYIRYPQYCRPLVMQAPHPRRDLNTGRQAFHVFRESNSAAFMMAGTHRCNSEQNSSCSGSTTVCSGGASQAYPISDLAHHVDNVFQQTTAYLFQQIPNSYFFSLHGFTQGSNDPYLIMSNGTRVTPNPDYISLLADALAEEDPVLTTEAAHLNPSWTRLIGFTNVQGRLINGSDDACEEGADQSEGRFLHIEQERTRLRNNLAGWNKMANAVESTFSCVTVDVEEVMEVVPLRLFPNPTTGKLQVESPQKLTDYAPLLFNHLGQNVSQYIKVERVGEEAASLDLEQVPNGLYYLQWGQSITRFIHQR
ncbi:MAG: T9SS type A sorting domain-containing protein [Bacteroidota bacterium]